MFTSYKKNQGEKLYEAVTSVDFNQNYPKTPDDVISYYITISKLIYGNYIIKDELFDELITIMQAFYSDEIKQLNPLNNQIASVKESLSELAKTNTYTIDFEVYPATYLSSDNSTAMAQVKAYTNSSTTVMWTYYLAQDLETYEWKITNWVSS